MSPTQSIAPAHEQTSSFKSSRWDLVAMGVGLILLAAAAFGPSLVNRIHRTAPITPLVSVHAVLFTAWVFLFLAQTLLIAKRRTVVHRRLEIASIPFAGLMVITGYETAIALTRRGFDLSGDLHFGDPLSNLVFPMGDLATFVTLFGAGLLYRRRPEIHKRLMLLATVGMMTPASVAHFVGHNLPGMPAMVPALLAVLFLAPAMCDRIRFGRFHRITLWGGILLFVWGNVRAVIIGPSAGWKRLAAWLIS